MKSIAWNVELPSGAVEEVPVLTADQWNRLLEHDLGFTTADEDSRIAQLERAGQSLEAIVFDVLQSRMIKIWNPISRRLGKLRRSERLEIESLLDTGIASEECIAFILAQRAASGRKPRRSHR